MTSSRAHARGPGADEYNVSRDPIIAQLYWRRARLGWSQRKVALLAGIAVSVINQSERGLHHTRVEIVRRWARALGYELELTVSSGSMRRGSTGDVSNSGYSADPAS